MRRFLQEKKITDALLYLSLLDAEKCARHGINGSDYVLKTQESVFPDISFMYMAHCYLKTQMLITLL
jgi:hypothetical protein